MRIARKTASVGGKSQKVTGTRRGIRFLRSENKIYKSQTSLLYKDAPDALGQTPARGSPRGAGHRPAPASQHHAESQRRLVPDSGHCPGRRVTSAPRRGPQTATAREDLPLLRTPGRPWPADQESRVVRKSTSALLRGRPQVCDRWRRSARSAARLGSREPAPPLEPRP